MKTSRFVERIADFAVVAGSLVAAPLAKLQARIGPVRLPLTYKLWDAVGVTPIRFHYYEPIPRWNQLATSALQRDPMLGVDLNVEGQLALLGNLNYAEELLCIPFEQHKNDVGFHYDNSLFGPGDAEAYYSMIRHFRPRRIIEIGGGYSTLIARLAVAKNAADVEHICIEPYEQPWLDTIGLSRVIRSRVEDLPLDLFARLERNDILFIDSSHVLRTGGDVWFEYLRILPHLRPGVLVHAHDIFLPYPYPESWLTVHRRYWTEQYVLQAVLQSNSSLEIVLAMHFLSKDYPQVLGRAFPVYGLHRERNPGSFWFRPRHHPDMISPDDSSSRAATNRRS